MTAIRRALEVIFLPVANTVSSCITEQINAVKVKKVGLKSSDMTSVDVSKVPSSIHLKQETYCYV